MVEPEVLTADEVAAALRITYRGVLGLIHRGELPARKLGRGYRIRRAALDVVLGPLTPGTAHMGQEVVAR